MSPVRIDIVVSGTRCHQTRSYGWQLVRTLDLFVFEDDGLRRLDLRQHIADVNGWSMLVSTSSGGKRLVVFANLPEIYQGLGYVTTYDDVLDLVTELKYDSPESPVMSGEGTFVAGQDIACSVLLEPVMSRIDVNSIECVGEASGLSDLSVYLTNVNGRCGIMRKTDFLPEEVLCAGGLVESDLRGLSYPSMLCRNLKGKSVFGPVSLYCYPNDSDRETMGSPFTRLVIEGTLDGERRYYPVEINRDILSICPGIGRNRSYNFDITLSSRGYDSPEHDSGTEISDIMGSVAIFPSTYISASVGDMVHVWCKTCPDDVVLSPDFEILDDDMARGMHEYVLDEDGRGVLLTLLKRGTSIVYFSAGPPVDDDVMAIVVAD